MTEESVNEAKEFRHALIQKEYRSVLSSPEKGAVTVETVGVVILSGVSTIKENGEIDAKSPENRLRIRHGIEIIKQIVAKNAGKDVGKITKKDILKYAPTLILNGESEQLPGMKEIAGELRFPFEKIQFVVCGKRGEANTKTQFQAINNDPRFCKAKHLTFITSDYHVPRTIRTAKINLPSSMSFDILPAPHLEIAPYSVFRVVRGEVGRIEAYSTKGDISKI